MGRAKLKDIVLDVTKEESPNYANNVTDRPVEDGTNITDHVRPRPTHLSLFGVISEEAEDKFEKLKEYKEKGELLDFRGRNRFKNLVIETLHTDFDIDARDGYSFQIDLVQIRTAEAKIVDYVAPDPAPPTPSPSPPKTKTKETENKGRQQPTHPNHENRPTHSAMERGRTEPEPEPFGGVRHPNHEADRGARSYLDLPDMMSL